MANPDVTRIAGNIGALNALNQLTLINNQLAIHQARLASGKRIMQAADDPAGMSMATSFDVRREGLQTSLKAIGDAKNLMANMEGGLTKIQDILVKMRNKALEAEGDTIGSSERQAIYSQLKSYRDEINDIVQQTQWNGTNLIGGSGSPATIPMNFLTSDDVTSGSASSLTQFYFQSMNLGTISGSAITISQYQNFYAGAATSSGSLSRATLGLGDTNLDVTASGSATSVVVNIEAALRVVKAGISQVGAFTARLTFKEENVTTQYTNTEAAYNRIMNADMAAEQVEASKYAILQQTATAMLAQANQAPQFLLTLFQ